MGYYFAKRMPLGFEQVMESVKAELKAEGFGIITEIDMSGTLRAKLGVDLPAYRILGACHPPSAFRALQAEPNIGLMLPCNVIVRQEGDEVVVAAIDPIASMQAVDNPALGEVAVDVQTRLRTVIERL
jgi:uncharacterized protein (DUF302 family)